MITKDEIRWKLSKDTLQIGNYLCYKATALRTIENSKGTHELKVIAWYTVDIPLPYGPDGYGGLPGLILQLEDNGTLTFIDRINTLKDNKIILPTKGEKITENEFNNIMTEKFENRKDNRR